MIVVTLWVNSYEWGCSCGCDCACSCDCGRGWCTNAMEKNFCDNFVAFCGWFSKTTYGNLSCCLRLFLLSQNSFALHPLHSLHSPPQTSLPLICVPVSLLSPSRFPRLVHVPLSRILLFFFSSLLFLVSVCWWSVFGVSFFSLFSCLFSLYSFLLFSYFTN